MKDFAGRVALITGAAHGFGKEFVKQAAQRGMKIAAVDIMEDDLKAIEPMAKELGAEDIILCPCDVTEYEQVKAVVAGVIEKFGQIDLLMNNAGVATFGPVWVVPPLEYEWIIDTNLKSHVYFMHEVIPYMIKQGTPCNIVNTCSAAGTFTSKSAAAYQASKFGALALTESVYYDLIAFGVNNIHISAYCPGFIQTNLDHSEEYKQDKYKVESPYYGSELHQKMQGAAKYLIMTGRAIDESGPVVFKAIEDDQLYIITHEHYDHVGGIDDLRAYCIDRHFPVYARQDVIDNLRERLPYCFAEHPYPGVPLLDFTAVNDTDPFIVQGINVLPIPVMHYRLPILGFSIGPMAYITDCKTIAAEQVDRLRGIPLLVINALRIEPHLSHMHLAATLEVIRRINPGQAYLTHMSHGIGLHADAALSLPSNVHLAYDGLIVNVP